MVFPSLESGGGRMMRRRSKLSQFSFLPPPGLFYIQPRCWFIHSLTNPFPPNIQDIINPKPLDQGSWIFERMITFHHVSHVTCQVSGVTCHVSLVRCQVLKVRCHMSGDFFLSLFFQNKMCRVYYQWGLPHLVFMTSFRKIPHTGDTNSLGRCG